MEINNDAILPKDKDARRYTHVTQHAVDRWGRAAFFEPEVETRNRKPLTRETNFGARWEFRFGGKNELRVFYSVYPEKGEVHILAVGIKIRERLRIRGKAVKL